MTLYIKPSIGYRNEIFYFNKAKFSDKRILKRNENNFRKIGIGCMTYQACIDRQVISNGVSYLGQYYRPTEERCNNATIGSFISYIPTAIVSIVTKTKRDLLADSVTVYMCASYLTDRCTCMLCLQTGV